MLASVVTPVSRRYSTGNDGKIMSVESFVKFERLHSQWGQPPSLADLPGLIRQNEPLFVKPGSVFSAPLPCIADRGFCADQLCRKLPLAERDEAMFKINLPIRITNHRFADSTLNDIHLPETDGKNVQPV